MHALLWLAGSRWRKSPAATRCEPERWQGRQHRRIGQRDGLEPGEPAVHLRRDTRFRSPPAPAGSFVLLMVMRGSLFSFNRTGMASWSSKRHGGSWWSSMPLASAASRVRPRSRLSRSIFLIGQAMLTSRSSGHRRTSPIPPPFFQAKHNPDCQGARAEVSLNQTEGFRLIHVNDFAI